MSARYMARGSSTFSPSLNAAVGLTGPTIASTFLNASSKSRVSRVRTLLTSDFEEAFKKVDAIVGPVSPTAAFKLGEKVDDPLAMYLADIYTVTADLAGIPGISVPCGETKEKLPIGLQILGRHFDEATILRVAQASENAA